MSYFYTVVNNAFTPIYGYCYQWKLLVVWLNVASVDIHKYESHGFISGLNHVLPEWMTITFMLPSSKKSNESSCHQKQSRQHIAFIGMWEVWLYPSSTSKTFEHQEIYRGLTGVRASSWVPLPGGHFYSQTTRYQVSLSLISSLFLSFLDVSSHEQDKNNLHKKLSTLSWVYA